MGPYNVHFSAALVNAIFAQGILTPGSTLPAPSHHLAVALQFAPRLQWRARGCFSQPSLAFFVSKAKKLCFLKQYTL